MKKILFTICSSFLYLVVIAQPMNNVAIDSLVQNSMKAFNVPGIAVAIIKDGKIIHSKGYGVRSLKSKTPVDENTLFGIASNSKAFTAATLAILVDEGKISWDDKVRKYIPEFKMYDPYVTEEFTIRDLLTHRSGLGLGAGDLMFFPDGADFTMKDIIHNIQYLKPVSSFRSKFDYDNNLYLVAGEIVARVSGKGWDEFVEDRILKPLEMKKSAAAFDRLSDTTNIISAHAPVDGVVEVIDRNRSRLIDAAGGINSNISDLSKWVLTLLNEGKYGDNKQLFSTVNQHEMWSPQTILSISNPGPYNTHFVSYGLGFFLSDAMGYKRVSHTGGLEGMVTQITMFPELQLGIIVLTNQQEGGAFTSITNQIVDGYLNIKNTDRVSENAKRRKAAIDEAKIITDSIWNAINSVQRSNKNKIDVTPYIGKFKDLWFGEISISNNNGKLLFASKRSPRLTGELFYFKGNTFVVKWNNRSFDADAFVTFRLDENGTASGITMKAISPLTDFSYDFHDLEFYPVK